MPTSRAVARTAPRRSPGPNSPLVVYGDTSQDAVWYSGEPFSVKGQEFGPKPFDPFWKVPESQNEDDEWLMPVADPYDFFGNDIIDASGLFSWIVCTTTACQLPSVGFTAYGGEGNDLIIGSQAGDHLAGGSGDDTILGLRGADHIYGDGGVNVDIFTRGLRIEVVNQSPAPSLDPRPIPDVYDPAERPADQAGQLHARPGTRSQPGLHGSRRRRHPRRGLDHVHGRSHRHHRRHDLRRRLGRQRPERLLPGRLRRHRLRRPRGHLPAGRRHQRARPRGSRRSRPRRSPRCEPSSPGPSRTAATTRSTATTAATS